MYGRINKNGALEIYRKKYIAIGKRLIVNPTEENMHEAGYKPLLMKDMPKLEKGQTLDVKYVDSGDFIETVYAVKGGLK